MSVLAEPRSLVPYGCTVERAAPFPSSGIAPGQRAILTESGLAAAGLSVDWTGAEQIDLSVDTVLQRTDASDVLLDVSPVIALLREYPPDDGVSSLAAGGADSVYAAFLRPRMPELFRAFGRANEQAAIDAVRRIAGCGVGLTPSSDDLLTGYFAAVHMLCIAGRADGGLRTMLPSVAAAAAERTNAVSGAFLIESGEGLVSMDFRTLLSDLFTGAEGASVLQHARRVASFGSTSGRDMLTGLVLAIQHHDGGKNSG